MSLHRGERDEEEKGEPLTADGGRRVRKGRVAGGKKKMEEAKKIDI